MATSNVHNELSNKPFASEAIDLNVDFWQRYCQSRPTPTDAFLAQILCYHTTHSDDYWNLACDVGSGPGNIAARLIPFFEKVVASDINPNALEAGKTMFSNIEPGKLFFVRSPSEELPNSNEFPGGTGNGQVDLVIVPECMPLLDQTKSMDSFHTLLRPHGTLAIYFYGRPIFVGDNADKCNEIYEKIATRICEFLHPMKGTATESTWRRSGEALTSFLDNISVPAAKWSHIERHKWNSDHSMLFNHASGYDVEFEYVDRRGSTETSRDIIDRDFWSEYWDIDRVKAFLTSVYPGVKVGVESTDRELEALYAQLEAEMGGASAKQKVTFPVCLILASKQ